MAGGCSLSLCCLALATSPASAFPDPFFNMGEFMGLCQSFETEPVGALRLRTALTVSPLATVREAIELMREHQLGCVFVVDRHERPIGMFHERILLRLLDENPGALDDSVARHLDKRCNCVRSDEPIGVALWKVEARDMRFIGVVDAEGCLVALTGEKGLMEFVADHFPRQVMVARPGMQHQSLQREGA